MCHLLGSLPVAQNDRLGVTWTCGVCEEESGIWAWGGKRSMVAELLEECEARFGDGDLGFSLCSNTF